MTATTLEHARAAKQKLRERLASLPELRGIGITARGGGYAVKVNVVRPPAAGIIPDDVDGVPVIIDVVGTIAPLQD